MHIDTSLEAVSDEFDFAALLEESLAKSQLERGDLVEGTVLSVDNQGLIVDVGWKHDGVVSRQDIERLGKDITDFELNEEIEVVVVRLNSYDDNLILSVSLAKQNEDWKRAEVLKEADEAWNGEITDANRGGLIIPFGNLRGFVPASHVVDVPRGLDEDRRLDHLRNLVGQEVAVKVIEVNRKRRRLVFSQRDAEKENRNARKDKLLAQLAEGDTHNGVVSGLCDFGAFVDLGGADGLIHISELAWHRVRHPNEVVNIGDDVSVFILNLDDEGKRIGLSLKRLQPNPWSLVEDMYHIGQLVEGVISRVEPFGGFVSLEPGIEALLHVSQLADDPETDPNRILYEGQRLLMRVISIEAKKQRLGLSLKEVTAAEKAQWEERLAAEAEAAAAELAEQAEAENQALDQVELDDDQPEAEAETGNEPSDQVELEVVSDDAEVVEVE